MIEIRVRPQVAYLFLTTVLFLTLAHCLILFFFLNFDQPELVNVMRWFDLDMERNLPSFYSSGAILACSFLFSTVAFLERKSTSQSRLYWLGLALVFLFLSLDEYFELHEGLGDLTENYINARGLLYFPWVIPYGALTLGFGLVYAKFILGLPKKTARLFILSGVIYLSGAIFLDMLGGREAELHGFFSITYCILYTLEEFFEMIAIVLLIYALLAYIEQHFGYLCINLQIRERTAP